MTDRASKRLVSEVIRVSELNSELPSTLFALFRDYYDCVDEKRFARDLAEKDSVIILRDVATGEPRGFSTQKILQQKVDGQSVRALFSGDTVIDRAYWGEQELVRGWCRFAGAALAQHPEIPLYWFLISKGYRTYLYLPLFYHHYYPNYEEATPPREKLILDTLAAHRFSSSYDSTSGTLRFLGSLGHLKPALADTPAGRIDDPHVRFFLERNPGYAQGAELVCLARIAPDNMKSFARRWLLEGMREAPPRA